MTRYAFVVENLIGHRTFAQLLQERMRHEPSIESEFHLVDWTATTRLESLPAIRTNWTLRASVKSARMLLPRVRSADLVFFHTQSAALLSPLLRRMVPTVISTDATPRNLDTVATAYEHRVGSRVEEWIKQELVGRAYRSAAAVVPWSAWTATSLVRDYGVDPSRVTVIKPSIVLADWRVPDRQTTGPVRVLFVGGDFARKGGNELIAALDGIAHPWALDVVSGGDVPTSTRVRLHRGLLPGSSELHALYEQADLFALPTHADALPWVLLEAMASGLPVITSPVGAIPETVTDGVTGLLVQPGDGSALTAALERLMTEPSLRLAMGRAGRRHVEDDHDADTNLTALLGVFDHVARSGR